MKRERRVTATEVTTSDAPVGVDRWWTAMAVAVIAAGIAFRVVILVTRLGVLDADEAVIGLMARHLLRGQWTTFFWGQAYGGTITLWLNALAYTVAGPSRIALKFVPVVLDAASVVVVWRVARHVAGRRAGDFAALACWVWPAAYVWWSTKGGLFYWPALMLGLLFVLLMLRIRANSTGHDWLLAGLVAGLGLWTTPQVAYLAVPAAVWLVAARPSAARHVPFAVPTAVVGALPWLVSNIDHDWWSLHEPPPPPSVHPSFFGSLDTFVTRSFPIAVGLRTPFNERWLVPAALGALVCIAIVVTVFAWALRRNQLVATILATYPFLYSLLPNGWYVGEARYLLYLSPFVAVGIGAAAARSTPGAAIALLMMIALTIAGLSGMRDVVDPFANDVRVPRDLRPLARVLERQGWNRVFADYWVAFRLDFETDERVIAAPASGVSRYKPYAVKVRAAENPVWVLNTGSEVESRFVSAVGALGARYERVSADGFVVYRLDRRVIPEDLPEPARP